MAGHADIGDAWKEIGLVTLLGTAACGVFSFTLSYLLAWEDTLSIVGSSIVGVTAVQPFLFLISMQLQENRRYRRELLRTTSHDPSTACLSGRAFATTVDRRARAEIGGGLGRGAFLLLEAQHLKTINLDHGWEWGEEALRLIASVIRSTVRSGDLIGRLGQGEFGLFLPSATEQDARAIGERIQAAVARVYFAPGGEAAGLTVTVGGVLIEDRVGFEDMFRGASRQLAAIDRPGGMRVCSIRNGENSTSLSRPH